MGGEQSILINGLHLALFSLKIPPWNRRAKTLTFPACTNPLRTYCRACIKSSSHYPQSYSRLPTILETQQSFRLILKEERSSFRQKSYRVSSERAARFNPGPRSIEETSKPPVCSLCQLDPGRNPAKAESSKEHRVLTHLVHPSSL